MGKDSVQRPRHMFQIQGVDERGPGLDLSARMRAQEAPQLLLMSPSAPLGLILESPKRLEIALSVEDLFHGGGTKGPDQLVLKVGDADVEAEPFHSVASEAGAKAGAFEPAPEVIFLGGVTQTSQANIKPVRAEAIQEGSDVRRTSNRHDADALGIEVATTTHS
jgi:hypothetical protein